MSAFVKVDAIQVQVAALHPEAVTKAARTKARELLIGAYQDALAKVQMSPRLASLRSQCEKQRAIIASTARDIRLADADLARLAIDPSDQQLADVQDAKDRKANAQRQNAEAQRGLAELTKLAIKERENAERYLADAVRGYARPIRTEWTAKKEELKAKVEAAIGQAFATALPLIEELLTATVVADASFGEGDYVVRSEVERLKQEMDAKMLGEPFPIVPGVAEPAQPHEHAGVGRPHVPQPKPAPVVPITGSQRIMPRETHAEYTARLAAERGE